MKPVEATWPAIEQSYTDEFGTIDREVYEAAVALWPQAEHFALHALRDAAAGHRLLMKACALVTRRRHSSAEEIANLPAYLHRTWRRLLLDELEKENGHRQREVELQAEATVASPGFADFTDNLDRKILVQQLLSRMDEWTRRVFEDLTLGYTFEEIGPRIGQDPRFVRNKFNRQIKRLGKQIADFGRRQIAD
jgi:DNA-directed RNA polymerase specialized sigma24 family protein